MIQLLTPVQVGYSLTEQELIEVNSNVMMAGVDCLGSSIGQFDPDKVIKFRNILNRVILVLRNPHELLDAYVRIKTAATLHSLDFEDMVHTIPAGGVRYMVGRLSDLFHHEGTIEETVFNAVVERTYGDFIELNVSHDAAEPVFEIGVFYV